MKNLTFLLLIGILCFSLCTSCDSAGGADADITSESADKAVTKNPKDNLSKEEVLERMNKANRDRSQVVKGEVTSDDHVTDEVRAMVDAKKNHQGGRIGADQAEQSARNMQRKYAKVKDLPPTAEQKKVAEKICKCLNSNPLFDTAFKAKSAKDLFNKIGDEKDDEIVSLQDCYNNKMVPAVNGLGEDAGIFAMKSRTYLNKICLGGTDKFWINLGAYLTRKSAQGKSKDIKQPEVNDGMIIQSVDKQ